MGAFVNVGAQRHGLVPRSKLTDGYCSSPNGIVEPGEQVTVWVCEATPQKFILSLVKSKSPAATDLVDLSTFNTSEGSEWFDGRVEDIKDYGVFVVVKSNDGSEAKGLVHKREIQDRMVGTSELTVGQEVRVRVLAVDETSRRLSLSMKQPADVADSSGADLSAFEVMDSETWLQGRVVAVKQFGALVSVSASDGGMTTQGLLHRGQIKSRVPSVGQQVNVRVLKVDPASGRLELTMKEVADEAENAAADTSAFESLAGTETWLPGRVANTAPYGVFVSIEVPGESSKLATGLVHVSEIKDGFVSNPADEVRVGQEVQVRVLSAAADGTGRLSLSMRRPRGQIPKESANDVSGFVGLSSSVWINGVVTRITNFGAFVQVAPPSGGAPPAQGLLHISEMSSEGFVSDPAEVVEVGQELQVRVTNVDAEQGRLSLSVKAEGLDEKETEPASVTSV